MRPNEISNWNSYPDNIKFFSVHFTLDQDIKNIERATYDFLDLLGDCGGVLEILVILFQLVSYPLATMYLKALITSKMFIIS